MATKTKTKTVRVLVKEPGKEPEIREISADLDSMQKIVGGYIQVVPIPELAKHKIDLYCDEEGKFKRDARQNFLIFEGQDVVVGTAFFAGHRGASAASLTDKQEKIVRDWLNS